MRGCRIGYAGIDALLVVRISRVSKMEEKSGHLALFRRGEGRDAMLDFFNTH